jgi:hypothetical protein
MFALCHFCMQRANRNYPLDHIQTPSNFEHVHCYKLQFESVWSPRELNSPVCVHTPPPPPFFHLPPIAQTNPWCVRCNNATLKSNRQQLRNNHARLQAVQNCLGPTGCPKMSVSSLSVPIYAVPQPRRTTAFSSIVCYILCNNNNYYHLFRTEISYLF